MSNRQPVGHGRRKSSSHLSAQGQASPHETDFSCKHAQTLAHSRLSALDQISHVVGMLKQRHSFTVGEARDLIYIRDLLKILRNFGRPLDTPSKTEPLNLNPRLRRSFSAPCSSKFAARVLLKRCRQQLVCPRGIDTKQWLFALSHLLADGQTWCEGIGDCSL